MTRSRDNYFRYLPAVRDLGGWGIWVSAAGYTRVPPASPYPTTPHPADHHFEWSRGRVLDALQIVLVTGGRGWLETRALGPRRVEPGMAFALVPGIWHRYRPSPQTGWEESWVEVQGPLVDELRSRQVVSPDAIIRRNALAVGLDAALEAVHDRVRAAGPGLDPELSAHAFRVLALWDKAGDLRLGVPKIAQAVARAERRLNERLEQPIDVQALAAELGVAYSHFRRSFKAQTGYAPWEYVIHQRLAAARRILASTDSMLAEIAERLGFNSAFHLSRAFRQAFGLSPAHWRQQLMQGHERSRATARKTPSRARG